MSGLSFAGAKPQAQQTDSKYAWPNPMLYLTAKDATLKMLEEPGDKASTT